MRRAAQIVFQNPDSSLNPRKTVRRDRRPADRSASASRPPAEIAGARACPARPRAPAGALCRPLSAPDERRREAARRHCARASRPSRDFIVCDEPVSALDVSVQAAIVNLLADLQRRLGVAYLFISHDISVVAHLADRIAVMYRGRIVETGPPKRSCAPRGIPIRFPTLRRADRRRSAARKARTG